MALVQKPVSDHSEDEDSASNCSLELDSRTGGNPSHADTATSSASSSTSSEENLISLLPDDCLAAVFRQLNAADLAACSLVCQRWMSTDSESRPNLSLRAATELTQQLPRLLERFCAVQKLVLKCDRNVQSVDDAALTLVAEQCLLLRKLKLKNCKQVTDEGMERFTRACPHLRKFSVGGCGFGTRGLNALLGGCPLLEDLTVKRSMKPPADRALEPLTPSNLKLRRLCLKDQSNSTIWTPLLEACGNLETLILARNGGYWDRVLESSLGQKRLPELSQVYLEKLQLTDRGLQAVARCPKLEALVVVRTPDCTDAGMAAIAAGCTGLRRLHIEGWAPGHIGDTGLGAIARCCRDLQELVLVAHSCTAASLKPLATNCRGLERLTLCSSSAMGDLEMACLAYGCPSLRRLGAGAGGEHGGGRRGEGAAAAEQLGGGRLVRDFPGLHALGRAGAIGGGAGGVGGGAEEELTAAAVGMRFLGAMGGGGGGGGGGAGGLDGGHAQGGGAGGAGGGGWGVGSMSRSGGARTRLAMMATSLRRLISGGGGGGGGGGAGGGATGGDMGARGSTGNGNNQAIVSSMSAGATLGGYYLNEAPVAVQGGVAAAAAGVPLGVASRPLDLVASRPLDLVASRP
ncbi:unnamed protein product [Closterium sp. Naga37s-1]|nr:unnamed protein product [Closterium sp. Naga37s-1]